MHRSIALGLPLAALLCSFAAPQDETGGVVSDEITQEELDELVSGIQVQIEELRGQVFKHPVPASVIDRAGFLAFAKKELAEDTTPEELAADEQVAKLFGLVPPDMDLMAQSLELLEEQVGGFYDPEKDEFFLMSSFTGGLAKIILAHELTHALDDQYQDLDAEMKARRANRDAAFAYQAVVEGSATVLMNRWTMQHLGDLSMKDLAASGDMGMEVMGRTPPFVWKPLLGSYMKGAAFLNRTESVKTGNMGAPPLEDVQRAFAEPPLSSEQVLHPEKYWDPEKRDDPIAIRFHGDGLAAGWTVLGEDTMGEMGLAMVVEPLKKRKGLKGQLGALFAQYTNRAAEGWGGDRYVLLGKGGARVLCSVSTWDSEKEAKEFVKACAKLEAHVTEGAAALALRREQSSFGHFVVHTPETGLVRFVTWTGATRDEVNELIGSLGVSLETGTR